MRHAAKIGKTVTSDEIEVQSADGLEVIVVNAFEDAILVFFLAALSLLGSVFVFLVRVDEQDDFRELLVVIDDVR